MTSRTIDPNRDSQEIELSVVIPCLNEADTLADCVRTAQTAIRENRIV
jgi:glycosyltransferase involved in cell wall biosynthesis